MQELKKEYELDKQAFQDLDQTTRVPHLLIEIRSLGFVEIQGKDTGGIYKRLEALEFFESAVHCCQEWLKKHWKMVEKKQDVCMVCREDEPDCDCSHCRPTDWTAWKLVDLREHERGLSFLINSD